MNVYSKLTDDLQTDGEMQIFNKTGCMPSEFSMDIFKYLKKHFNIFKLRLHQDHL